MPQSTGLEKESCAVLSGYVIIEQISVMGVVGWDREVQCSILQLQSSILWRSTVCGDVRYQQYSSF